MVQRVLSGNAVSKDHHGYGVRNIHERLQLSYGIGFGLRFQSVPGKGTSVRITIPAAGMADEERWVAAERGGDLGLGGP